MTNLQKLIKQATSTKEGRDNIKLTGDELVTLVKSRRVKVIQLGMPYTRYLNEEQGYQGYTNVQITRKQALEVAKDFKDCDIDKDGNQLYYRVYVSSWKTWNDTSANSLYINL